MKNVDMNNVEITGTISNLEIIYQNEEEIFYKGLINSTRNTNSNIVDSLPITISGSLLKDIDIDSPLKVIGQLRTKDSIDSENGKLKLSLYIYCIQIENIISTSIQNENNISIDGYVVKRPNLRTTPSGKQISDLLIACNYGKDKTAYIPCIAWGRNARLTSKLNVGDYLNIEGRLQSRKYNKIINGVSYERVAYELSINNIN